MWTGWRPLCVTSCLCDSTLGAPMNLAIIPARGGSKRIKQKNIVDFCGKPMIAYSLDCARDSQLFEKIHVSTDDEGIAQVAAELGYPVDFMRAPELADDMTPLMPVITWVLQRYLERGAKVESVCLLMPCAPLLQPADLRAGYKAFQEHGSDLPLASAVPYAFPVQRALYSGDDGLLHPLFPEQWPKRSQDLTAAYHDAGAFYFFSTDHVLRGEQTIGENILPYFLPSHRAVDIDTAEDLELAEIIYRGTHRAT